MPPRFGFDPPAPLPAPTPNPPTGLPPYRPPTAVPAPGTTGPVFGGPTESTAPPVGIGWSGVSADWRRPLGGARARDDQGLSEGGTRPGMRFETQPADQVQRSLYDMPAPELRALQRQMYDAGFYGDVTQDAIVYGTVDDRTWEAYGDLLEASAQYNAAGREVTWFDYLDEVQRLRKEQGTNLLDNQGPKRAPFVARTTAAADIGRIAEDVAREITGQNPDPGLVARIVARYQGAEVSSQRAAYNAAETGGTVADVADPTTFAEQQITAADPQAVEAYRVADETVANFLSLIRGPFGD